MKQNKNKFYNLPTKISKHSTNNLNDKLTNICQLIYTEETTNKINGNYEKNFEVVAYNVFCDFMNVSDFPNSADIYTEFDNLIDFKIKTEMENKYDFNTIKFNDLYFSVIDITRNRNTGLSTIRCGYVNDGK